MKQTMFTYEAREQMLVIHSPKKPSHYNCRNLRRDMDLLLAGNYINRIVFDLTHTSFMGSSGIGVLLNRYKQMATGRGTAAYYRAEPQVRRMLGMGGISRLVRGYGDRESAIRGRKRWRIRRWRQIESI